MVGASGGRRVYSFLWDNPLVRRFSAADVLEMERRLMAAQVPVYAHGVNRMEPSAGEYALLVAPAQLAVVERAVHGLRGLAVYATEELTGAVGAQYPRPRPRMNRHGRW